MKIMFQILYFVNYSMKNIDAQMLKMRLFSTNLYKLANYLIQFENPSIRNIYNYLVDQNKELLYEYYEKYGNDHEPLMEATEKLGEILKVPCSLDSILEPLGIKTNKPGLMDI